MTAAVPRKGWPATIKNLALMLLGSVFCAVALNIFFLPANLTMGGVSGITSIVYNLGGQRIDFGLLVILMNIPIFLAGAYFVNRRFVINSLIGTLSYGLIIDLSLPAMQGFYARYLAPQTGQVPDLFIATIIGGVVYGIGLGLMLRAGYTTGGTDIIGILIKRKSHHLSLGQILWVLDVLIIAASFFFYRNEPEGSLTLTLYSFIAMYLTSKAVDMVVEGIDFKRTAFIISPSKSSAIANRLLNELDRGVTGIHGRGMYTGDESMMLMTVVSQEQLTPLRQIVTEEDPDAFLFLVDTREVMGEGFSSEDAWH